MEEVMFDWVRVERKDKKKYEREQKGKEKMQ
jgi:hypothetical protein